MEYPLEHCTASSREGGGYTRAGFVCKKVETHREYSTVRTATYKRHSRLKTHNDHWVRVERERERERLWLWEAFSHEKITHDGGGAFCMFERKKPTL